MTKVIRTTDRGHFKRCRQQWDFGSKIRRNYEPVKINKHLEFGTAFHRALEVFYNPNTWQKPRDILGADAKVAFQECNQKQRDDQKEVNSYFSEEDNLDYKEREVLGVAMLDNYVEYSKINDNFTPIATEVDFSIPLENFKFDAVYEGRIDLIGEDEDGMFLWDHKTTSKFDEITWLELDTQISSYCWAATVLGFPVQGFVYNEIRKSAPSEPKVLKNNKLSKDKSQPTTYNLYLKSIQDFGLDVSDYTDFLDYLSNNPVEFVRRTQEYRNITQLRIQEEMIYNESFDMLNNPFIYPNPSKFNCNRCEFYNPCVVKMEGGDVDDVLDDTFQYVQRTD